ncbi:MAG TPA: VOC family protein [Lysobacter sp.]
MQQAGASTIWNAFPADTDHFAPGSAPYMVNFRVADLAALLDALRSEGCHVVGDLQDSEYGKFGWVVDPEGNKIELWEPPAGR